MMKEVFEDIQACDFIGKNAEGSKEFFRLCLTNPTGFL